jgi:hypothetical protein
MTLKMAQRIQDELYTARNQILFSFSKVSAVKFEAGNCFVRVRRESRVEGISEFFHIKSRQNLNTSQKTFPV